MIKIISSFLLITFVVIEINAESYLVFPEQMLPPVGTVHNLTFTGSINNVFVAGVFASTAIGKSANIIVGYRFWQGYSGANNDIVYTTSYANGTSLQALVDLNTRKCDNNHLQRVNCTGWSYTNNLGWNNLCVNLLSNGLKSIARMTATVDPLDNKFPTGLNLTISTDGLHYDIFATYQFHTKHSGRIFPSVKCDF